MNDMSSVIVPRSDQLNADTLLAGPQTVTIKDVIITGGQEQPVSIVLEETDLFFRPCKSMSRVLVHAWGPDAKLYVGRSLTLYRDPSVKWGGLEVGGIRISHMSHIDGKMQMQLTATKGQRRPHVVLPLVAPTAKPDKAAAGVAALIADLQAAGAGKKAEVILASADVVKQREWLAAKRPELAALVDACVAALEAADDSPFNAPAANAPQEAGGAADSSSQPAEQPEGPSDDQRGETTTLESAKAEVDAAELVADVNSRVAALLPLLGDEDADALRNYGMERIEALGGGR